jgi:Bacterial extracellular solute-binding protein
MRRWRATLAGLVALLAAAAPARDGSAASASHQPVGWPIVPTDRPADMPVLDGSTDTVPDIVGRLYGPQALVIFTEGNNFPVLLGSEVLEPFRAWARADPRFAALALDNIVVVSLPQHLIVAMLRAGGIGLGNTTIEVGRAAGFYPDIVTAGAEPLRELRRAGVLEPEAQAFARSEGPALLVRKGNPAKVRDLRDLARPSIHIVLAGPSEAAPRGLFRAALVELMGAHGAELALAHETVMFPGRLGIQHRDVPYALAEGYAEVGILVRHLALYYARVLPDLVEMLPIPGAERFGSTIALARVVEPPHARAADAFMEYFLGIAEQLYPRYGFAAMAPGEYRRRIDLGD